jgi:DNA-binding transcriptional LysR family regulator
MNLGAVDTNLVVPLRALLHEQSISRAAQTVGLAQSSMSHALARLRAHYGDPLLVASGRRMVLTERARALIEPVELAVSQLERVFTPDSAFDPSTSERTFRVAATDNMEFYLLPKLVPMLAREAPRVRLDVHHLPSDWMRSLSNGDVDLKLGRKYEIPAAFHSEDLFEERFTCVVRRKHPFRGARPTLEQFSRLSHLAIVPSGVAGKDAPAFIDDALAAHGIQRRVLLTVSHFLVAPYVVAASDLALTVSERVITPFLRPLGLRILRLPAEVATYRLTQVWAERSERDPGHAWLRQTVARAART